MRASIIAFALAVCACGNVNEDGAPDAAAGGTPDAAVDGVPISCDANAFLACTDAETLRTCNATGDGVVDTACGAAGCNAAAGRCNECVPDAQTCDGAVVERCDADGLALPDEACALSCVDAPTAHCAYLSPRYLPDVCDALATEPAFTVASGATLDTSLDTNCTGGVVTQSGPPICVVRAGTIAISAPLTVTGFRVLALVADGDLTVASTLDLSANGTTSGPGGGARVSGARANANIGGGGAGFNQPGANGGSTSADGGGGGGGPAFDPLATTGIVGGAQPAGPTIGVGVSGGGGGGAATLISCRGTVTVSGLIDAGGGGGQAGYDTIFGAQVALHGGGGGGSGGYVVIQGLGVSVTGRLYANGGGGGGGGANDTSGGGGGDATRSSTATAGGGTPAAASAGAGGTGGIGAASPNVGRVGGSGSPGGGGGSTGRFQVYAPATVTPTVAPTDISPPFEPVQPATTR